ncbi:TPA: DUF362 domain-containing protein [Candidatus Poribacteria bacterium]|nr:DUF362 domain-containing protein [Candidatus Poribacteria bacterium]
MELRRPITRRDFLRGSAYAALAAMFGKGIAEEEKPSRSKVVLVRHPDALDEKHNPNPKVISEMLDDAVKALTGADNPVEAWRRILNPNDLVGIKTNVWAYMPTPREVEEAIKRRVIDAGVPEERIKKDDRGARKTLADCTALINARPLRTHHWAGIGGCIKNYAPFAKYIPKYHPNACADLGHIWTLPIVKGKTRLNVLVVLRPLFHGRGPHHFNPKYQWDYKGLLVSFDPVAVDAVGVHLLTIKRRGYFGEDIPFPNLTHHVIYADVKYKLGVSDLKRIDLIKIGWEEDILI